MKTRACAVLIGIFIAVAGLVAAGIPASAATTNEWRISYRSAATGGMYGVVAISPRDAWAVGTLYKGQTPIDKPDVLHWNGKSWAAVTIPGATLGSNQIAASGANDVWIFGYSDSGARGIYRWDGAHWHTMSIPWNVSVNNLVVLSASSVWTSGQTSCTTGNGGIQNCVTDNWHWNGAKWTDYPISAVISDIAGTSATNLWATGMTGETQLNGEGTLVAYRWNGSRWSSVSMPHPRVSGYSIVATDGTRDVWLGAWKAAGTTAIALHWNGSKWQQITAPASVAASPGVVPDGHGGVWLGPWAHWTGRSWVNTLSLAPPIEGGGIYQLVKVPGTSASYWGAAGINTSQTSTTFHPAMLVYGPLP